MTEYTNRFGNRTLKVRNIGGKTELIIKNVGLMGQGSMNCSIRDEDRPEIALDILGPPAITPLGFLSPTTIAINGGSDEVLLAEAWRNLAALRIRRESEKNADSAASKLEADALKYASEVTQTEFTEFRSQTARQYWTEELTFSRKMAAKKAAKELDIPPF